MLQPRYTGGHSRQDRERPDESSRRNDEIVRRLTIRFTIMLALFIAAVAYLDAFCE